jgi:hypothetical protein
LGFLSSFTLGRLSSKNFDKSSVNKPDILLAQSVKIKKLNMLMKETNAARTFRHCVDLFQRIQGRAERSKSDEFDDLPEPGKVDNGLLNRVRILPDFVKPVCLKEGVTRSGLVQEVQDVLQREEPVKQMHRPEAACAYERLQRAGV